MSLTLAGWGGVAGLGYVAAVIVGNVVAGTPGEASASDARLLEFYNDSGNQWRAFIGALLIGVAALAFVAYLYALCDRLAQSGVSWPGLVRVAFASGIAFIVVDELGVAIGSSIPAALVYSDELTDIRDAESARVILILGKHWLSGLASLLAAPLVLTASLQARRLALMPSWLAWVGLVLSVLLVLSQAVFLGIPILAWIAATAVWLLWTGIRRSSKVATSA